MTTRMRKRRIGNALKWAAGTLVGIALVALLWFRPWQTLDLGDPTQYVIVEVETINWREPPDTRSTIARCKDAKTIGALVDLLSSATHIIDCKCAHAGFIRLTNAEGAVRALQLIPGHDEAMIDLRYNGARYQLARSKLQPLLDSIGATPPGEP